MDKETFVVGQTNTKMPIVDHPVAIPAEPTAHLWKYMRRPRFDQLLSEGAMFFCRVIDYANDDHLEGAIPDKDKQRERMFQLMSYFRNPRMTLATLRANVEAAESLDPWGMRESTIITCLTMRDTEVRHMWKEYAGDSETSHGVAIRTTVAALTQAFAAQPLEVYGSQIKYINHKEDSFGLDNVMRPLLHKFHGFTDEHEYRLLHTYRAAGGASFKPSELWEPYGTVRGLKIAVDLAALICEVWVSPHATEANVREVKEALRAKGISAPVRISQMSRLLTA